MPGREEVSNSNSRMLNLVDQVQSSMLYLFQDYATSPFAVTSGFVYELVHVHGRVLRGAVENRVEDATLRVWAEQRERFRRSMLSPEEQRASSLIIVPSRNEQDVRRIMPLLTLTQLRQWKTHCPDGPIPPG